MKRAYIGFLFLWLLARGSWGEPLVLQPNFEQKLVQTRPVVRRHVSTRQTVDLYLTLYRMAGPRVGSRLVDPADMLTLSGIRGLTSWNGKWKDGSDADLATLTKLDQFLVPQGISLEPEEDFLSGGGVEMVNLAGVERVSTTSHMPGTLRYDASSGWPGYQAWSQQQRDEYQAKAPVPPDVRRDIYYGLLLGYPDRAVLGYMGADHRNERSIQVDIQYSAWYECGQPTYNFLPVDLDDRGLVDNIRQWGSLLHDIYTDPAMLKLAADPQFIAARRAFLNLDKDPTMGWWSDERGRLGLWTEARWKELQDRSSVVTDRTERVFRDCATPLCEQIRAGASTADLVRLCHQAATRLKVDCSFSVATLRNLANLGYYESSGPHVALLTAAREVHAYWLPQPPSD